VPGWEWFFSIPGWWDAFVPRHGWS